jgi:hypothetical protein
MKSILLIVTIVTFLTSCSKKDTITKVEAGTLTPLAVSASSISTAPTKASQALIIAGKMGVFQTSTSGGYSALNNVEYDYNTGTSKWGVFVPAQDIYLNNNMANVCAYYPYNSLITNASIVALTSQPFNPALPADNVKDLCFSTLHSVNNSSPSASFSMGHAFSQITLKIRKDATYTGTGAISLILLSNPTTLLASSTLNITNGIYGTGIAGDLSFNPAIASMPTYDPTNAGTILATTTTSSVLMVPVTTTMTTDLSLSFTVDGINLTTTVPKANLSQLIAGTNYGITVVILGNKLVINSVTVTDWISTDIATPVYPHP